MEGVHPPEASAAPSHPGSAVMYCQNYLCDLREGDWSGLENPPPRSSVIQGRSDGLVNKRRKPHTLAVLYVRFYPILVLATPIQIAVTTLQAFYGL